MVLDWYTKIFLSSKILSRLIDNSVEPVECNRRTVSAISFFITKYKNKHKRCDGYSKGNKKWISWLKVSARWKLPNNGRRNQRNTQPFTSYTNNNDKRQWLAINLYLSFSSFSLCNDEQQLWASHPARKWNSNNLEPQNCITHCKIPNMHR